MKYDREMSFLFLILGKYHISYNLYTRPYDFSSPPDMGLRKTFFADFDYDRLLYSFENRIEPNTIYRAEDSFGCKYIIFSVPDENTRSLLFIGPYLEREVKKTKLNEIVKTQGLPATVVPQLEDFFYSVPIVENDIPVLNLAASLGEVFWGSMDNFTIKDRVELEYNEQKLDFTYTASPENEAFRMRLMEQRYEAERMLMDAVSHGQAHKAEIFLSNISHMQMEVRSPDPIRNLKNYSVVMNTLFRKAVESGGVHPMQIDSLSSRFAKKIEAATEVAVIRKLQKEMLQKYCLLVNKHSLKGYSQLIRKVITRIEYDMSADLSLHTQAELLNVNPSYLSTLFKKETGKTLTEYVNQKRVEHAVYLLSTTNLQIQIIAQQCGIPDVNYFTKTFKKYMGKTPRELRETASR